MHLVKFFNKCPVELYDNVEVNHCKCIITDIALTHYVKTNTSVFTYQLDNNPIYVKLKFLQRNNVNEGYNEKG